MSDIKGDRGERGPHGNHGQDGRQGPKGDPGADGTTGATGRRGAHLKGTDARLVFLFAYVTIGMVVLFVMLSATLGEMRKAENQLITNCDKGNAAARTFNAALDQMITNSRNTTGLTLAQKRAALKKYSVLHLAISECPPKQ